ncbi:MAG: SpoIIE family protein phosphatase [Candidatus Eremiobacteraeota bacterium]|nr:SpoIIE family protein phosphatase [Candidatus Eremiobacteraeota bacterium]
MAIAAALDYGNPTIQLRPISYVFVMGITALVGYRWGLVSGIAAALLFTSVETATGYRSLPSSLLWNVLIAAVSFSAPALLMEAMRRRKLSADATLADLASTREELADVKRLHESEAALRLAEQRYIAVGESLPFGTWEVSADGRDLKHLSESYCKLFGMTRAQIAQGGWRTRVPPDDAERFLALWNDRKKGDAVEGEYRVLAVDGKTYWVLVRGVRLRDADGATTGWAGFSLDITERKRVEQRLSILSDLGRVLSQSLEPMSTLERASQLLVPRLADWCAVDLIGSERVVRRALLLHHDASTTQAAAELPSNDAWRLLFGLTASRAIATQQPELRDNIPAETKSTVAASPAQQATVDAFQPTSLIVVPLVAREQTLGALTIATTAGSGRRYVQDDVDFAGIIARRIALALDNAMLYEREHRVADMFQRASLPSHLPSVPGIAIHVHYQSGAREAEIGGDWYDAFQLSDGRIGISIGDVAGKGLQAASIMSTVRLLIRATALEDITPSRVMARANQLLLNDRPTMVTAIFGVLDPEELTFTCSVAGHPLPLVANAEGDIATCAPVAPPLGVAGEAIFPEQTLMLPLGSLLVLYTDGLVESNRHKTRGEEILHKAVQDVVAARLPNAAEAIASRMVETPFDDVAVLTVAPSAKPLLELDLTLPAQPASGRIFRQALRRFYVAAGLGDEKIQLLQVALGEAITNSIQHAYGVTGGDVRVQGRVASGMLIVEVGDTGRWRGPHDGGAGYGLQILKSIVQDVSIEANENGTTVRLTQPIGRVIT